MFNSLIDNLLYLLFDDTRLDGLENKMIKTIEVIPILLDMIFKETISVEILKCYLERLKQISQCKYNQCIFIQ